MADIISDLSDALAGIVRRTKGRLGDLTAGDNQYGTISPPPSADAAKKLTAMAEEQARRAGVTPKLSPTAKKALMAPRSATRK